MEPPRKRPRIDFEPVHSLRLIRSFVHRPEDAVDVLEYFSTSNHAVEDVLIQALDEFGQFKFSLVVEVNMRKVNPATGEVVQHTFYFRSRTRSLLTANEIPSSIARMFDTINEQVCVCVCNSLYVTRGL